MKSQTKTCLFLFIVLLLPYRGFASQLKIDDIFTTSIQDKELIQELINDLWDNDNGILILGRLKELIQGFELINFCIRVTTKDEAETGESCVLKKLNKQEELIEFTIQIPNLNIHRPCLLRKKEDNNLYLYAHLIPKYIVLGHELIHVLLWLEFFNSNQENFLQLINTEELNLSNFKAKFDHWVQKNLWPDTLKQYTKTEEGLRIFKECWEQADEFPVIMGYKIPEGNFKGSIVGERLLYPDRFIPWSHETCFSWSDKEVKGKKTFTTENIEVVLQDIGINRENIPIIDKLETNLDKSFLYVRIDYKGVVQNSIWRKQSLEREKVKEVYALAMYLHDFMDAKEIKALAGIESFNDVINPESGSSLLHSAALMGEVEVLDFLIKNGCDVEARNKYGTTSLYLAIEGKQTKAVKFLVEEKGANVNARNSEGKTPLHVVATSSRVSLEIANILLNSKAVEINAQDIYGFTALISAVLYEKVDFVKKLLDKKADVNIKAMNNITAFHIAAFLNNTVIMNLLIDAGCKDGKDVEIREKLKEKKKRNEKDVIREEEKRRFSEKCEEIILRELHDLNKDFWVHFLQRKGRTDLLDKYGIEPPNHATSVYSVYPLTHQVLVMESNLQSVQSFLSKMVDIHPNEMNELGHRVYHLLASSGDIEKFKQFIKGLPSEEIENILKSVDGDGNSCLHWAVRGGHIDFINYALEKIIKRDKIFLDAKNSTGFNALGIAIIESRYQVAKLLLEWGAKAEGVSLCDVLYRLYFNDTMAEEELVELMIKNGADVNAVGDQIGLKSTPLYIAQLCLKEGKCSQKLIDLMKSKGAVLKPTEESMSKEQDILGIPIPPILVNALRLTEKSTVKEQSPEGILHNED